MVILSVGVRPETQLAREAASKTQGAIRVNEFMQTNFPDIYAAGDCVESQPVTGPRGFPSAPRPISKGASWARTSPGNAVFPGVTGTAFPRVRSQRGQDRPLEKKAKEGSITRRWWSRQASRITCPATKR